MSKRILITGNEACAEAALRAGMHFYAGYPITPQNELIAYMAEHAPPRGRVFIQSESELAAINMVFGAAATGARAMTSSSSPGVSLKQEGISYMAGARLPGVIVNVMRGGPGLGNISGSQSDYFQATRGGGHGDYRTLVYAPWTCQEIADLTFEAFDRAEQYRIPVIMLFDGSLGQTMEAVAFPEPLPPVPLDRFDWVLSGADGRPERRLVSLIMAEGGLEEHNRTLQETYRTIERQEARAERFGPESAQTLVVAFGMAGRQAADAVEVSEGRATLLRPVTLWPFPSEAIREAAQHAARVLVVEMNAGQMVEDVRLALNGTRPIEFLGRAGGGVPEVSEILARLDAITTTTAP